MEILVGVLGVGVVVLAVALVVALRRDGAKGLDDRLKLEFQSLTQSALRESREELERELARHSSAGSQELEGKKALIDQQLYNIRSELTRVSDLVRGIEKDREAGRTDQERGGAGGGADGVHRHASGGAVEFAGARSVGGADGGGYFAVDGHEGGGELSEAGDDGVKRLPARLQLPAAEG